MGFLMAIFHSVWFCARSWSIFRDLKSLSTTWVPSLWRSTLSLLPLSNYISALLHHAIITASLSTWPNKLNLPLVMQLLILSRPKRSPSSEEAFLSFKVTLHIYLIILISMQTTYFTGSNPIEGSDIFFVLHSCQVY